MLTRFALVCSKDQWLKHLNEDFMQHVRLDVHVASRLNSIVRGLKDLYLRKSNAIEQQVHNAYLISLPLLMSPFSVIFICLYHHTDFRLNLLV